MGGWLKLHRRAPALPVLLRRPGAWALLTLLAVRARWQPGIDPESGLELDQGEALTRRSDAALLGISDKQYRGALAQLSKMGIVKKRANQGARWGARWGTVIKIVDSTVYDIYGTVEGQVEGQQGANKGPGSANISPITRAFSCPKKDKKEKKKETPLPPRGGGPAGAVPGGAGNINDFNHIAEKLVTEKLSQGRKISNIAAYQEKIAKRIASQGGPTQAEIDQITPSWDNPEIARTRNYLKSLENGD